MNKEMSYKIVLKNYNKKRINFKILFLILKKIQNFKKF